jgi:hypothetical protein
MMKASNGSDRVSTREELNQVLAVLSDLTQGAWILPDDEIEAQVMTLGADEEEDASAASESVAELFMNKPQLQN